MDHKTDTDSERATFEVWHLANYPQQHIARHGDTYKNDRVSCRWQAFQVGRASLAASAGSEPEPFGHWFTDDPKMFAMPGAGFLPGKEPPKDAINVIPLYTHPSPPEGAGWISVDKRLPEKNAEVLIAFSNSTLPATGQYTGSPRDNDGWCYPGENDPEEVGIVTHWMSLPEAPNA